MSRTPPAYSPNLSGFVTALTAVGILFVFVIVL